MTLSKQKTLLIIAIAIHYLSLILATAFLITFIDSENLHNSNHEELLVLAAWFVAMVWPEFVGGTAASAYLIVKRDYPYSIVGVIGVRRAWFQAFLVLLSFSSVMLSLYGLAAIYTGGRLGMGVLLFNLYAFWSVALASVLFLVSVITRLCRWVKKQKPRN